MSIIAWPNICRILSAGPKNSTLIPAGWFSLDANGSRSFDRCTSENRQRSFLLDPEHQPHYSHHHLSSAQGRLQRQLTGYFYTLPTIINCCPATIECETPEPYVKLLGRGVYSPRIESLPSSLPDDDDFCSPFFGHFRRERNPLGPQYSLQAPSRSTNGQVSG
jgi:hypothetical protein